MGTRNVPMRWTAEADTARDVLSWPEEFDDFQRALRSNFDADVVNCYVDPVAGSVSARFSVEADTRDDAETNARRIMVGALEQAGLRVSEQPLSFLGVTPSHPRSPVG